MLLVNVDPSGHLLYTLPTACMKGFALGLPRFRPQRYRNVVKSLQQETANAFSQVLPETY